MRANTRVSLSVSTFHIQSFTTAGLAPHLAFGASCLSHRQFDISAQVEGLTIHLEPDTGRTDPDSNSQPLEPGSTNRIQQPIRSPILMNLYRSQTTYSIRLGESLQSELANWFESWCTKQKLEARRESPNVVLFTGKWWSANPLRFTNGKVTVTESGNLAQFTLEISALGTLLYSLTFFALFAALVALRYNLQFREFSIILALFPILLYFCFYQFGLWIFRFFLKSDLELAGAHLAKVLK